MKNILSIFIAALYLVSCQKEIKIDLNEANPKVVIEANYSADDSTVLVLVSATSNYFNGASSPEINNAIISIVDQNGIATNVPFSANGKYILNNYIPTFNSTYTMNVVIDGTTYTSSCVLPNVVSQDNLDYQFLPDGFFGSPPGYLVFLNFNDPITVENYYMAVLTENDTIKNGAFEVILQDDKFTDGNAVKRPLFNRFYQLNDTIDVELRSIDKNVFAYYNELQSLSSGSNSAAPANPKYFWTNKALGYFSCFGSSKKQIVIQ